jgi:predicted nucleic acid-binding protein
VSYLLDTNVLSETRKRRQDPRVAQWVEATPADQLYVSVLTLGEIEQGIARVHARGDGEQAVVLARWLRDLEAGFGDRIIPVTLGIASEWGRQQLMQPVPVIDGLIAATARVHGWMVVTRNTKDFERTGARVLNPFGD